MSIEVFRKYTESIFWNFKRRDNVEYNFEIVLSLTSLKLNNSPASNLHFKPVCIIMAAILECTMYDFLTRVKEHTQEKIPMLDEPSIRCIKDIDLPHPFSQYNALFRKYRFLGDNNQIYDDIDKMIGIRNRAHIQNLKKHLPLDEREIWNENIVCFFGNILKSVYEYLTEKHPRTTVNNFEKINFPEPWK